MPSNKFYHPRDSFFILSAYGKTVMKRRMLYNNKHETAYIRMFRENRNIGEFKHRSYPITGKCSLKNETGGCVDPRKFDYFEIVQRSGSENKEHRSSRIYVGSVFFPLSRNHEKKYPDYFKQELEEKIGWTGDVVITANQKTIPLRSTDRVIDSNGNYVYPVHLSGLTLPFSYEKEREDFEKEKEKFIETRWYDRLNEYKHTLKMPILYNFKNSKGNVLTISSEDYEPNPAKGEVYLNLGGTKKILGDDFFNDYKTYHKVNIYSWYYKGDIWSSSEGPYQIGILHSTEEKLKDQNFLESIKKDLKKAYNEDDVSSLEDFMIQQGKNLLFYPKKKPIACVDRYMNIKAINKKMLELRANNFLTIEKGDDTSFAKICEDIIEVLEITEDDIVDIFQAKKDLKESAQYFNMACPSYFVN